MSHSLKDPKRVWDAGMRDDDYVAIVVLEQNENDPLQIREVSPVHFIKVGDMRAAFAHKQVTITKPKGVEEGSEIRVIWTCAPANQKSTVTSIDQAKIVLTGVISEKKQTVNLKRNRGKITLLPQVQQGVTVESGQIVAAVVTVQTRLAPTSAVGEQYFIEKLSNFNPSERYASAKALRYRGYTVARAALAERMNDSDEDIYVQLEAAAALAAFDVEEGWKFLERNLYSSPMSVPLETQLETLIVVSEIQKPRSVPLLIGVLQDVNRDDELRAGAAWALGEFPTASSANALVETFNSHVVGIKVEAARALLRIAEPQIDHLIQLLKTSDPSRRDGISWALARTGGFDPTTMVGGADDNLRRWASYIVGIGRERFIQADIEAICDADPEVYFAASVLWQIVASWIYELKEY